MRKDFYVFRHGETELNRQKRWQGSGTDCDLNAAGVRQAEELLEKFRGKKLEVIFSSPLIRARHTAEVVAGGLGLPVIVRENIRECFYGEAEGQPIADLAESCPEILNNWYNPAEKYLDIRFPGGESKKEARDRVLKELDALAAEPYQVAGAAIHGGTMGQLLNYYHVPYDKIPNCAALHLVYEDGNWRAEGGIF